jgi:hypothetical protein
MQTTLQQGSWEKQWGRLVAKAWSDESLKQRLIEDPATVLREQDIEVPYDVEIKVLEDTDQVRHLILPASPSGDLSDEDLGGTVGYDGFSFGCFGCRGCGGCGGCGRCGCGCDSNS